MKKLYVLTGLITVGLIFWTALAYLMGRPSFQLAAGFCMGSIVLFFLVGFLKNRDEKMKFREFLASKERDGEVQEKLKHEKIDPGDKTGRSGVKTHFKERNVGVNWTGASVHGAVPHRKKRRTFLPKNR